MHLPLTITTTRLHWRPLMVSDAAAIYRQFSDPDMCRYFTEPPCSYSEAQDIISHYRTSTGRYMRWVMCDATTEQFVGTCGYHYLDESRQQVELGYDIWKAYWGAGYMREVLPMLIDICRTYLPITVVYVLVHRQNAASIRVAERAGFVATTPLRQLDSADECCLSYQVIQSLSQAVG